MYLGRSYMNFSVLESSHLQIALQTIAEVNGGIRFVFDYGQIIIDLLMVKV